MLSPVLSPVVNSTRLATPTDTPATCSNTAIDQTMPHTTHKKDLPQQQSKTLAVATAAPPTTPSSPTPAPAMSNAQTDAGHVVVIAAEAKTDTHHHRDARIAHDFSQVRRYLQRQLPRRAQHQRLQPVLQSLFPSLLRHQVTAIVSPVFRLRGRRCCCCLSRGGSGCVSPRENLAEDGEAEGQGFPRTRFSRSDYVLSPQDGLGQDSSLNGGGVVETLRVGDERRGETRARSGVDRVCA